MSADRTIRAFLSACLLALAAGAAQAQTARQIGIGETLRGELASGDPTRENGSFYDLFSFPATAGQSYVVTLTSDEFDPYLEVTGPGGLSTENDDARDGVTSSRVEFTAPATGEIRIRANSLTRRETGRYSVALTAGAAQRRIQPAEQLNGDLSADSPRQRDGTPYQAFLFDGRAGESITIDMKSRDFDSYLVLRKPGSAEDLTADDDAGGGMDAQVFYTLPTAGTYEIRANAVSASARGRFTLKLSDGIAERKPPVTSINYGRVVRGELKTGSGRDGAGLFYDSYSFAGHKGDKVTLSVESGDFDPVLYLGLTSRQREDDWLDSNDDESATVTDSLIQAVLPADATYEVHVVSYNAGEAGRYVLGLAVN